MKGIQKLLYSIVAMFGIVRIFYFLGTGNPSDLIWVSMGIYLLIILYLTNNKYITQIFILTTLILTIFSGLILVYTYLFLPIYVSTYEYYLAIAIFLIYIFFLIWGYLNKWDSKKLFGE